MLHTCVIHTKFSFAHQQTEVCLGGHEINNKKALQENVIKIFSLMKNYNDSSNVSTERNVIYCTVRYLES